MLPAVDLEKYPINQPNSDNYAALVSRCRAELKACGMFNLEGFMTSEAVVQTVTAVAPRLTKEQAFVHVRNHNIYFDTNIALPAEHPAMREVETKNMTLCADQCCGLPLENLYQSEPFAGFLADTLGKKNVYMMDDPLARFNVMGYPEGWGLNWHFDRSQFTTTLLLQAPKAGGVFEYRPNLRSDQDPNYEGVARVLEGKDETVKAIDSTAGALNVFLGRNTAHRVTPVIGGTKRIVAVFTYFDHRGARFSRKERLGFYGRAE